MTTGFGSYILPSEDGFRTVLAVGAGAALLGFLVAAFVPRQRGAAALGEPVTAEAGMGAGSGMGAGAGAEEPAVLGAEEKQA
ncbi:hypothetical protein [Streptomyces naganishii]